MARYFERYILSLTLPPPPSFLYPAGLVGLVMALGLAIGWLPLSLSVMLIGGTVVMGVILTYPGVGLYLLIPVIPFSPLLAISAGGVRIGAMELLLAAVTGSYLLQLMTRHAEPSKRWPGPLFAPFVIFLAAVGLSWLVAFSLSAVLVETVKWVEMLVLYGLVLALIPPRQLPVLVAVILATGVTQAGLGLYQFVFKVGPPGFLLFDGLFLRAYGTFAQPNPYAGFLGLTIPLALALMWWSLTDAAGKFSKQTHLFLIFVLGGSGGLMLLALFASQSRGGLLGFAAAATVTLVASSRRVAAAVVTGGLLGATVLIIGSFEPLPVNTMDNPIMQRFVDAAEILTLDDVAGIELTDANFSTLERLAHWQAARAMWRDNPWLGVGFGNYAAIYPAYVVGPWDDPLGHAHNYILNIGAEMGLVGLMAYLIFWIWVFAVLLIALHRSTGFNAAIVAGSLGILTHLHVHNMVDNLYVQGMYLYIAVILGLAVLIYQKVTHYDTTHHQFPSNPP